MCVCVYIFIYRGIERERERESERERDSLGEANPPREVPVSSLPKCGIALWATCTSEMISLLNSATKEFSLTFAAYLRCLLWDCPATPPIFPALGVVKDCQ